MARLPAEAGPSGEEWTRGLDRLVRDLLADWDLRVDGPALTGQTAVVLPVLRDAAPLALKVGWPHAESAAEHIALRVWDGLGAVGLVAADPGRGALLLERLDPGRDLLADDLDAGSACTVIGGLLARLHVAPPPSVPRLTDFVAQQVDRIPARSDLPRRIGQRVSGLARELLGADDACATLVHGDLHYANVLAGHREPWLAIDPKPMAGHPGWEIQAVLRNRVDELGSGAALRWSVRWRLETLCDAMGLDPEVGRLWAIVHTGVEILWALEDGDATAASLHISILKALED